MLVRCFTEKEHRNHQGSGQNLSETKKILVDVNRIFIVFPIIRVHTNNTVTIVNRAQEHERINIRWLTPHRAPQPAAQVNNVPPPPR